MELGGPLKDAKLLGYVPGPGQYNSNVSTLEPRSISLKSKLPDNSQKHLLKVQNTTNRTQDQALTATKKWEVPCTTPLPNFVTSQITK